MAVAIADGGNYQLTDDLNFGVVEGSLGVTSLYIGTDNDEVEVNLYLSGHSLSSSGCAIVVMSGSTLNLYSGNKNEETQLLGSNILDEGETISGKTGLSVEVEDGVTYTYGGGVAVYGTFNMYGGTITGNTAVAAEEGDFGYGGGVYVFGGGTFNMYGGAITDNKASTYGGGVAVRSESDNMPVPEPLEVDSAEIKPWEEVEGGDVSAELSIDSSVTSLLATQYGSSDGTFNFYGGTIEANEAPKGGGVYVGGTVVIAPEDSSTPAPIVVTGNKGGNLYVPKDRAISVGSALGNGSKVGVTMENPPGLFARAAAELASGVRGSFTSDNGSYYVSVRSEGLSLEVVPPPTYSSEINIPRGGGTASAEPLDAEEGEEVVITPQPDEGKVVDEVTVTDKDGNPVEVTDNGDGTWIFKMPEGGATVTVTFRCDGGGLCPSAGYVDVDTSAWYHEAIDWAVTHGVMTGYEDGSRRMGVADPLLRQDLAVMFHRLLAQSAAPGGPCGLPDVEEGSYYQAAVDWCFGAGIMTGYDEGTFGVGDDLTREQLVTVLWRVAGSPAADASALGGYPDGGSVSEFAREAMAWAADAGAVTGREPGEGVYELDPQGTASRAEVATILWRLSTVVGAE